MRPLFLVLLLVCHAALGTLESAFHYTPHSTHIEGTLETRVFPGPPNYESVRKGDAPESVWLLRLPRAIEVRDDGNPKSNNETEKSVRELQLILPDGADQKALDGAVGHRVKMSGKLVHAIFGHHHSRVLLDVQRWSLLK